MPIEMQKEVLLMMSSMPEMTFGTINEQYPLTLERFTEVLLNKIILQNTFFEINFLKLFYR